MLDFLLRLAILAVLAMILGALGGFGTGVFLLCWFFLEWLFPAWCGVKWGGATPGKPVGTVCFALAHGRKIHSEMKRFKGNRQSVRRRSVIHAMKGVLRWL